VGISSKLVKVKGQGYSEVKCIFPADIRPSVRRRHSDQRSGFLNQFKCVVWNKSTRRVRITYLYPVSGSVWLPKVKGDFLVQRNMCDNSLWKSDQYFSHKVANRQQTDRQTPDKTTSMVAVKSSGSCALKPHSGGGAKAILYCTDPMLTPLSEKPVHLWTQLTWSAFTIQHWYTEYGMDRVTGMCNQWLPEHAFRSACRLNMIDLPRLSIGRCIINWRQTMAM